MTTSNREINAEQDIDAILSRLAEPHNRTIAEQVGAYDAANGEVRNAEENRQRFEKAAEASKAAAETINQEIRDALGSRAMDSKAAHKKRAERAGHLEDVEIYLSMAKEAEVSRASSELKVRKVATAILDAVSMAQLDVETALRRYLKTHLSSYRPLMLFLRLVSERADSGDSTPYNERSDIHSTEEFALSQFQAITHAAFANGVPREFGSRAFLRPLPSGLVKKRLTPCLRKQLESELSAMTAAL